MNIMAEVAIIFGICLLSEGIAAVLPFSFPASVISMVILMALLLTGGVKPRHIQRVSGFLVANMAFFFIPSFVGTIEYAEILKGQIIPFFAVVILTTPVVYLVTAWTVQLMMLGRKRKEKKRNA